MKPEEEAEIIIWDWLKTDSKNIQEIYFNRINKINAPLFTTKGINKKPDLIIKVDFGFGVEYIIVEVKPAISSQNIHKGKKIIDYYLNSLRGLTTYLIQDKEITPNHFVVMSEKCKEGRLFNSDPHLVDNTKSTDHWRKTNASYKHEPQKEYQRTSDYVRSLWNDFREIRNKNDLIKGGCSVGIIMNDLDIKKPHLFVMKYNKHLSRPKWGARYLEI